MICENCGRSISGEGERCPYCGVIIKKDTLKSNDIPSARLNILSFFVPPIGIYLYFKRRVDRPVMCHRIIESVIVGFIFYIIGILLLISINAYFGTEKRISEGQVRDIYNLSVSLADDYDLKLLSDFNANDKVLEGMDVTSNWKCIGDIKNDTNSLELILGINSNDIRLSGTAYRDGLVIDNNTCSSIRMGENRESVILLVAKEGGKYYSSGKVIYAFSNDKEGKIVDER